MFYKKKMELSFYYVTMAISIIAFYTLLTMEDLDVMRYLQQVEGDAVNKVKMIIPILYGLSLFFTFFLVVFAQRYRIKQERKEIGVYVMLGTNRYVMFLTLVKKAIVSALLALLCALPIAIVLNEAIALATAKIFLEGYFEHHFVISLKAMALTSLGYLAIQTFAILVIAFGVVKEEPYALMMNQVAHQMHYAKKKDSGILFLLGCVLLVLAYLFGMFGTSIHHVSMAIASPMIAIVLGIIGTYLFYKGCGQFLAKRTSSKPVLKTFLKRQLETYIYQQAFFLMGMNVLMVFALCCIGFGLSYRQSGQGIKRSADFTLQVDEGTFLTIQNDAAIKPYIQDGYGVYVASIANDEDIVVRGNLGNRYRYGVYLISLSSYNALLENAKEKSLSLGQDEVALYTNMEDSPIVQALQHKPTFTLQGKTYSCYPIVQDYILAADRAITIYDGLIVHDEIFHQLTHETNPAFYNLHMKTHFVEEVGMFQATKTIGALLDGYGVRYESFMNGVGRRMYYQIVGSYFALYMGIVFLLIANTAMAMKYLMIMMENKHRYQTLHVLGATKKRMVITMRKEMGAFFMWVVGLALVSGFMGMLSLLWSYRLSSIQRVIQSLGIGVLAMGVILVIEGIYLVSMTHVSTRFIGSLDVLKDSRS